MVVMLFQAWQCLKQGGTVYAVFLFYVNASVIDRWLLLVTYMHPWQSCSVFSLQILKTSCKWCTICRLHCAVGKESDGARNSHINVVNRWVVIHVNLVNGWVIIHVNLVNGWVIIHVNLVNGWLVIQVNLGNGWVIIHVNLVNRFVVIYVNLVDRWVVIHVYLISVSGYSCEPC